MIMLLFHLDYVDLKRHARGAANDTYSMWKRRPYRERERERESYSEDPWGIGSGALQPRFSYRYPMQYTDFEDGHFGCPSKQPTLAMYRKLHRSFSCETRQKAKLKITE